MERQLTRTMRAGVAILGLAALAHLGCAAGAAQPTMPARALVGEELELLKVDIAEVASAGQVVRVRGHIQNLHSEEILGVTYRVRFYSRRDTSARILQTEKVPRRMLRIKPGERKIVSFDVESMYVNLKVGTNFSVDAMPMTLGGRPIVKPQDW